MVHLTKGSLRFFTLRHILRSEDLRLEGHAKESLDINTLSVMMMFSYTYRYQLRYRMKFGEMQAELLV